MVTRKQLITVATIIAALITAATVAILIVVNANIRATNEQNFQQCIAEAGGYTTPDLDEKTAIRDMCDGYLQ